MYATSHARSTCKSLTKASRHGCLVMTSQLLHIVDFDHGYVSTTPDSAGVDIDVVSEYHALHITTRSTGKLPH